MTLPWGAVVWQSGPGHYAVARVTQEGAHDAPFNRDLVITDRSPVGGDPDTASWRQGDGTVRPAVHRGTVLVVRRGPAVAPPLYLESRVELVCEGYVRVHVRHEWGTSASNPIPILAGPPVGVYHLVRDKPGGPWRRVRPSHPVPAAWALAAALDPEQPPF